eukprot:gb/GECG01003350.1/.p1 GENE.gb/GECG01003350.1/~~gb/GECG01003350.1/.p1  ORF type:complete len:198 (+),score=13.52 gb/GECG01003350.1/:1-594(+)
MCVVNEKTNCGRGYEGALVCAQNTSVVLGTDADLTATAMELKNRSKQLGDAIDAADAITALDCAYHFNSRRSFFTQAYASLKRGGNVALIDVVYADEKPERTWTNNVITWFVETLMNVRFVTLSEYKYILRGEGFHDGTVDDITSYTWPHLSTWCYKHANRTDKLSDKLIMNTISFAFNFLRKVCQLRVVLVSARKA